MTLFTFYFAKPGNQFQYRSPNATAAASDSIIILSPLGGRTCPILFTIQLNGAPTCFILLSCSPKYAITLCRRTCISKGTTCNLNKYDAVKMWTLFTFNFANRRIRPPNALQEMSNILACLLVLSYLLLQTCCVPATRVCVCVCVCVCACVRVCVCVCACVSM